MNAGSETKDVAGYARKQLLKSVVLKTKFLSIRSRDKSSIVFVFEGDEDVGVYEAWISRVNGEAKYCVMVAKGKAQLLNFYKSMQEFNEEEKGQVYYFIDRDFDGARSVLVKDDVYITPSYSVENLIIDMKSLRSILRDELKCHDDEDAIDKIAQHYYSIQSAFLSMIEEANLRIFHARKLGVDIQIDDSLNKYVLVDLTRVDKSYSGDIILELIKAEFEFGDVSDEIKHDFASLDPELHYRGKFNYAFFVKWLALLVRDRTSQNPTLFKANTACSFNLEAVGLRYYASRSKVPSCLKEFTLKVFPQQGLIG